MKVRHAIGATVTLTTAQRQRLRCDWFKKAHEFGERAALYLDQYARQLSGIPYRGDDVRAAFAEVRELEAHLHLLEETVQLTKDTLLHRRSRAVQMGRGVSLALAALVANPFLDDDLRGRLEGSLKLLRKEHNGRYQKISAALAGRLSSKALPPAGR